MTLMNDLQGSWNRIRCTLHTDGGSRGNPGPAAIGFSITDDAGNAICEGGWPIGEGTNNEAEYKALIWGLRNARAAGITLLDVLADSELMVKQMNGIYKVKNAGLKPLHLEARGLAAEFDGFSISHVMREHNKRPDELVNASLDEGRPVGSFLVDFDTGQGSLFASFDGGDTVGDDEQVVAASEPATEPVEPDPASVSETEAPVKTVLLGVTGCIAAYKSCEILRSLQKAGVRVKVVMTEHAAEFVGPATFRALTREPVAVGLFDEPGDPIHHISLAKEADLMLVAPATADVLVKLATGVADDLLTTTALATTAPIVVAPAMNVQMWRNERVQRAVAQLASDGVTVVGPEEGYLSCGDTGEGRLAEPAEIVKTALSLLRESESLRGKRIFITSGPTHEPIDPVRFIGNRSSGITGTLIAAEAARRGAEVTMVTGPVSLKDPNGVDVVHVQTADEMLAASRAPFEACDAAVFCAAVADFKPRVASGSKIKKVGDGDEGPTIELVRNPDILKTLAADKGGRYVVSFAAETGDVLEYARGKLLSKNADMIVANDVSDPALGFGTDDNRVWFVTAGGEEDSGVVSKREIARQIVDRIAAAIS